MKQCDLFVFTRFFECIQTYLCVRVCQWKKINFVSASKRIYKYTKRVEKNRNRGKKWLNFILCLMKFAQLHRKSIAWFLLLFIQSSYSVCFTVCSPTNHSTSTLSAQQRFKQTLIFHLNVKFFRFVFRTQLCWVQFYDAVNKFRTRDNFQTKRHHQVRKIKEIMIFIFKRKKNEQFTKFYNNNNTKNEKNATSKNNLFSYDDAKNVYAKWKRFALHSSICMSVINWTIRIIRTKLMELLEEQKAKMVAIASRWNSFIILIQPNTLPEKMQFFFWQSDNVLHNERTRTEREKCIYK